MINVRIKDIDLKFNTSKEVFSPENVDKGTLAMLSVVDFKQEDKILDLGCGYGIVGILSAKIVGAANVVMADVDENAVKISGDNIVLNGVEGVSLYQSDGFKNIHENEFTIIISNPPYHEDFKVPKEFIEKGFNRLVIGGKMYMVTKRKEWYKNKLIAIFGGVKIWEIDGYFVFMAVKKGDTYAKVKPKKVNKSKNKL